MDGDRWEPLSVLPRCLRDGVGGGHVCGSARPLALGQRPGGSEGRGAGVFCVVSVFPLWWCLWLGRGCFCVFSVFG